MPTPFGDTFDVPLENTPIDLLKMYPVIIATGKIANRPELINASKTYVATGGVLVVDSTT